MPIADGYCTGADKPIATRAHVQVFSTQCKPHAHAHEISGHGRYKTLRVITVRVVNVRLHDQVTL